MNPVTTPSSTAPPPGRSNSSGGTAAAGGVDFQHQVAAWFAARLMAGTQVTSLSIDLIHRIGEEARSAVDDIYVELASGGVILVQAKAGLTLSDNEGSEFSKAVGQFVQEYRAHLANKSPLNANRDRLVLAVNHRASGPIREKLKSFLERASTEIPAGTATNDLPANDAQRDALTKLKTCLDRHWQKKTSQSLCDPDLRALLSLIRVLVLDLEGSGTHSHSSDVENTLLLIKSHVVVDPATAGNAWDALQRACQELNQNRSSGDREWFQNALVAKNLRLKGTPAYQADIARLIGYSQRTHGDLRHLAEISLDGQTIKISRPVTNALMALAEQGGVLVLGDPGAGKSGVLQDAVTAWRAQERDVVFVAVDRIEAATDADLRQELDGLEHDLHEVLAHWPGPAPGILVIDALDAARRDGAARLLRTVIKRVMEGVSRWRVVASIREFDLEKSDETQRLFRLERSSTMPDGPFTQTVFNRCCHIHVPLLTQEELHSSPLDESRLGVVIRSADGPLGSLLPVPFHLRLLAELLDNGMEPSQLRPIQTQSELLDRYWIKRIQDEDGQRAAREQLLRVLLEQMVDARSLRVSSQRLLKINGLSLAPLPDLQSRKILVEATLARPSQHQKPIAFSTHVLFDFACVRLILEGCETPREVVQRVAEDPDLVLFLRPALMIYFHRLWTVDRALFWETAIQMMETQGVPEIGRLLPPQVAVELTAVLADLEPLLNVLPDHEEAIARLAGHLSGAVMDRAERDGPPIGGTQKPWAAWLRALSERGLDRLFYAMRPLMAFISDYPQEIDRDPVQRAEFNQAARAFLAFSMGKIDRDRFLLPIAIQSVARSMGGDVPASVAVLNQFLETPYFETWAYLFLPSLAIEIPHLTPHAPSLVLEIYRRVFGFVESRNDPHALSSGVLNLHSTMAQSYRLSWWQLAENFPAFFRSSPLDATEACIAVMKGKVGRDHSHGENHEEQMFPFGDRTAVIQEDFSFIWNSGSTHQQNDDALRILNAWINGLVELSRGNPADPRVKKIVDTVVEHNRWAVMWSALLKAGCADPSGLGSLLAPLLRASPILCGPATQFQAGELLRLVHPLLPDETRRQIEQVILNLPEQVSPEGLHRGERHRDRLLGYIPSANLVLPESIHRLTQLREAGQGLANNPPFQIFTEWVYSESAYDELSELGVPVEDPANARLLVSSAEVETFSREHLNDTPTQENLDAVFPHLEALEARISTAREEGAHPKAVEHAFAVLSEACARVTRAPDLARDSNLGALVWRVLLEAQTSDDPRYDEASAEQFNESPSWGGPSTRIVAAEGLPNLVGKAGFDLTELLLVLERLAQDPVPAVRFQIVQRLLSLHHHAQDAMWRILEQSCLSEANRGVLLATMQPLAELAIVHPERCVPWLISLVKRVTDGSGAESVQENGYGLIQDIFISQGRTDCHALLQPIYADPETHGNLVNHLTGRLRDVLTHGPAHPVDPVAETVRRRGVETLTRIAQEAEEQAKTVLQRYPGGDLAGLDDAAKERAQGPFLVLNSIATELYFASGAHDARGNHGHAPTREPSPEQRRFFQELEPVMDILARHGQSEATHRFLEMLDYFIPIFPGDVLTRMHDTLEAATRESAYHHDSLGAGQVVCMVERYLADFRDLFHESVPRRKQLLFILDHFVNAGWPQARRLVFRLNEVFV